jgi:hypothetical protein
VQYKKRSPKTQRSAAYTKKLMTRPSTGRTPEKDEGQRCHCQGRTTRPPLAHSANSHDCSAEKRRSPRPT